jgi:uncharacterized membrane protein YeaQ/YmgE (transglycosylase-associated protein family)
MQDTVVEESTLQLVIDQVEELLATLVEEIQERPGVAVAVLAGLIGAFVGARLAARLRHRRVVAPARRVGEVADLAGLLIRLLQNPIVRGLLIASIERQVKRQLSR